MLNAIKERKCQMFKKVKDRFGNETSTTYLVNEYNINELGPLSREEFEAIKKKQIAEGFDGQ
jgi:hypothetical protein